MQIVKFAAGSSIIVKGDVGTTFYIIKGTRCARHACMMHACVCVGVYPNLCHLASCILLPASYVLCPAEGEVVCTNIGSGSSAFPDVNLGPGGFFGERALISRDKRAANVTAVSDVQLLSLQASNFSRLLGGLLEDMVEMNKVHCLF